MGKNFKLLMTFLLCLLGMAAKAQTVEISTVDQLKAFRDAVNSGTTYSGQTVKLTADLDLSSEANWVPIGNLVAYPSQSFNGTFDGNGHKISNITCTDNTPNHAVAGLFGSVVNGTIKDLTVENVNITSTHYAGGIVAYTSNGPTIENCKVIGGTIKSSPELLNGSYDNGDKVGGIMGYATAGSTINNCVVENVTIKGYRDLGGIVGYSAGTVTNNTAIEVTVTQDLTNGYKNPTPTTVGDIHGGGSPTLSNNKVIKYVAQIGDTKYGTIAEAVSAATAGQTIEIFKAGDYTLPNLPLNITLEGTVDGVSFTYTTANSSIASTPNGATFKNITFNWGNVNYHGFQSSTGTINMVNCKNLGRFFSYSDMNFTNCEFEFNGDEYCMWVYGAGNVVYDQCTFTNNTKGKLLHLYCESTALTHKVTVKDCKFINGGSLSKAAINVKATSTNGALQYDLHLEGNNTYDGNFPTAVGEQANADKTWILNPLAQVDDRSVTPDKITVYENDVLIYPKTVAQIGDAKYPTLQSAVDAAQQMGGAVTVNIIDDISGETVTVKEVANFKLTIDGKKDASSNYTVDATIIVDGLRQKYGGGGSPTNGASVTIQNIAFVNNAAKDVINPNGYPHHLTIQDCTYTGSTTSLKNWFMNVTDGPLYGATIKNVTVESSRLIQGDFSSDVVFENITATNNCYVGFNIKTGPSGGFDGAVSIKNCQVTTGKYAFRDYSDGYAGTITLQNNTFVSTSEESDEGVIVNRGGAVGTAHINVESGTYTGHVKVLNGKEGVLAISGGYFSEEFPQNYIAADLVAAGKDCVPATDKPGYYTIGDPTYVAQIGSTKYTTLQKAVDAAHEMTGDVTIEFLEDISGYSIVHQKAGLNLTIDGKDKTLAGQIIIDGDGSLDGTDVFTIQNIKFEIPSEFCSGTDAFVVVPSTKTTGTPYYAPSHNNHAHNITISDCTFTGNYPTSNIVGFKSHSGIDGMKNLVMQNVTGTNLHSLAQLTATKGATFDNCSATQTGSFIGVNGGDGTYTVSNCTFASHPDKTDGYAYREKSSSTAVATLTNNNFKAHDAIILGSAGTINVESGTYVGEISKTAGTIAISDGHFSAPLGNAEYSDFIAEGKAGVNGLYPEDEAAPNGVGPAVATVTFSDATVRKYASLEAAVAAVTDENPATITMLADVTISENVVIGGTYGSTASQTTAISAQNITLDLNGHNISGNKTIYLAGGSLNITGEGTIENTGTGASPVGVRYVKSGDGLDYTSKRTLTIGENVTLSGAHYGLNIFGTNEGTVANDIEVNVNGVVEGVLFVLGNLTNAENNIVINVNGIVTATDEVGIALNGNAKVNVAAGAEVTGQSGIEVRGGELNVTGGTITATASEYSYTANNSGTTIKGAAIAVSQHGTLLPTNVTISDGTLTGAKSIAVADAQNNALANVTVTAKNELTENSLIPADFKWVANEDGITSTLAPCEYVAQYNGTKYESLQAAIDAAEADDPTDIVIDMLADCTLDITAWSGTQNAHSIGTANTQSITINGNNHKLDFNQLNSDWNNVATMNDDVTKLVLNDMTIANSNHNNGPWNRHDINFNCAVELNNVTSDKAMAFKNDATLNNVSITDNSGSLYGIWIQPNGQNVSIDGLTITAERGIKIDDQYVDDPQNTTLNIANATFNTTKKSAILVKSAALTTVNAGEGINIENVAADNVNPVWVDEDRAEEFYKVKVTGTTVVPETKESDYVAKLIDTDNTILGYYKALNKAITTATEGQTVAILQANTYTLPGLPLNITVEGAVEGVQFTHTTAGNVAAIPNGATFKNVAFNFGNVDYHGFQHAGTINMEGCTLNGKLFSYGDMNFTNCTFNQSNSDYHMWAYSGNLTYTDCTFTNTSTGKFLNVYNESGATKYTVTVTSCNFINQGASNKAALNVKATCGTKLLAYDVIINNCTTEGAFPEANWGDALVVLNNLAQVDDRTADGVDNIKVWQDDVLIYPVYVAQIGETQYPTLQSALNAAHEMTGDVTVELLKDIKGYSIVHQKAGLNLTIDGKDKTLAGQIFIDGNGRASGTETLTIKNFKFEGNTSNFYSGTDAFILVPSTKETGKPWSVTNQYNYAHNITVTDCSFTSTSTSDEYDVVCYKATSGAGEYNVTITNCTATGTMMHSLAQLTGTTGGSITNCTVTGSESFVNVSGGTGDFTVSGNTFTSAEGASGYGIRENGTSDAVITLTDNTFTAANAVVLGKGTNVTAGTINVVSGIYVGEITKTDAATGKIVISGGHFSASIADAAYADFIAEGLCGVNGIYLNETPEAPNGIGDAVASVTFADNTTLNYASLEAAIAAVPTDGTEATVTLLVDVAENAVVAGGKNFVLDLNEKTLTGYIDQYDSQITVQNGTVAGTVYVNGGATSTDNYNKFTLAENATINADYGIILYQAEGTTAGYGSTININGTVNGMVWVMGNITEGNSVVNVNSTAKISGDVGVALNGLATLNVADGATITGSEVGIEARAGVLNVEGGTITSTAAAYSFTPNGSGTTTFGAAIAVAQHNTGLDVEVNINGGTLNGVKSIAVADAQSNDLENVTVKVKDELVTDNTLIPEGFAWASNGDGTSSPKKAVAKIGDILYASLADAVAAVPAGGTETTITMIDNEMIDVVGSAVTIPSNKNVVIDLNGFQVVGTAAGGSTSALITNKGTLTIKDSSDTNADGTGTGQLISGATTTWIYEGDGNYAGSYASNTITNSGTLTIESGYIENLSTGSATYAVDNNSSGGNAILNMNGGLVKARSVAVREFANSTTLDNVINMAGGTITAGYSGIWIQLPGSDTSKAMKAGLNVTGGTIAGGSYAFYDYTYGNLFDATQYNLSGGTFDGDIFSYGANFTITDGTYNGEVAIKQAKPSNVAVSGGKFAGDVYTYGDNASEGFITGGVYAINTYVYEGTTYDCDWTTLLADGYYQVANTDPETMEDYPYTVSTGGVFDLYDLANRKDDKYPYLGSSVMSNVKVTYHRSIKDTQVDKWQAWFIPMDYTIKAEDLENFEFWKIHMVAGSRDPQGGAVDETNEDNGQVWIHIFSMNEGDVLKGNRPYVIKPKAEGDFDFAEETTKLYPADSESHLKLATSYYVYDFYGTYETFKTTKPKEVLWMASGKININLSAGASLGIYRWYIKPTSNDFNDDYSNLRIGFVVDGEEDPTSIFAIEDAEGSDEISGIYSVNGTKYGTTMDDLQKGVNIIRYKNGTSKKVLVK